MRFKARKKKIYKFYHSKPLRQTTTFLAISIVILCHRAEFGAANPEQNTHPGNTGEYSHSVITLKEIPPSDSIGVTLDKYSWVETDESSLEVRIFKLFNISLANPVLDEVMPFITNFRKTRVYLLLVWAALVMFGGSRGRWAAFILIPLVAASDQISSSLLKPLAGRIRPCEILGGIRHWHGSEGWIVTPVNVIKSYKSSFSFPSGHATNITASMLFLGLVYRRFLTPLIVVAIAVSCSRIYIGVHWPSDIVGGMFIGAALALPAYYLFNRLREVPKRKRTNSAGST